MALLSEMVGKISAEVVTVIWCELKTSLLSIVHFGALFEPELISDLILISSNTTSSKNTIRNMQWDYKLELVSVAFYFTS